MDPVTGSIPPEREISEAAESVPSGFMPQEEDGVQALKVYTVQDKIQMIRRFEAEGAPIRDFCGRVGVSTSSFCRWLKAYKAQGEAGLEPAENSRNTGHKHHGPHSPDARRQAVEAFQKSGMGFEDFARLWGVAPSSLRKWVERYERLGPKGLESMYSKKKGHRRLSQGVRQQIRKVREENPGFGLRKVRDYLFRFGAVKTSTGSISRTLREEGIARPKKKRGRRKYKPRKKVRRFERSRAGEMWQSDITTFLLARQSQRVYLTVFLDDHSRYIVSFALALQQRQELVIEALLDGIQKFGKPKEVLTDQGRQYFAWRGKTQFQGVLKREGIQHVVSRAHHPETLGKTERFWDTVETEFWERAHPEELSEARKRLDHFIAHYNHFRPHQGIDGMVPADRFFGAEDQVRKAIEETMEKNELYQAIGEAPRQTAYLVGQIGDQKVSLFGEKGRLVIQTSDGKRKEIGYDELGMDQAPAQEGGRDGQAEGAGSEAGSREEARDSSPVEPGDQGAPVTGLAGEGVVGGGERGGEAEGAHAGGGNSGELAGPDELFFIYSAGFVPLGNRVGRPIRIRVQADIEQGTITVSVFDLVTGLSVFQITDALPLPSGTSFQIVGAATDAGKFLFMDNIFVSRTIANKATVETLAGQGLTTSNQVLVETQRDFFEGIPPTSTPTPTPGTHHQTYTFTATVTPTANPIIPVGGGGGGYGFGVPRAPQIDGFKSTPTPMTTVLWTPTPSPSPVFTSTPVWTSTPDNLCSLLVLEKAVNSSTVSVGDTVTVTLVARNAEEWGVLKTLTVEDIIPAGLDLVPGSVTAGGTWDGARLTWTNDQLQRPEVWVMSYAARVTGDVSGLDPAMARFTGPDPKVWCSTTSNTVELGVQLPSSASRIPNPAIGQPVQIIIPLDGPAQVKVTVYSLTGEQIWTTRFKGTSGDNTVVWEGVNRAREAVSSGLYVVMVEIQRGSKHDLYTLRVALIQ